MVDGSNVLFYLHGSNSFFDWGSDAKVKFKGLTSGALKGMVLWGATANASPNKFGCHSTSYLQGGVYTPTTEVQIGSNGTVNAAADWTVWVVKRLTLGSSSGLAVKVDFSTSVTPMPGVLSDGGLLCQLTTGTSSVSNVHLIPPS